MVSYYAWPGIREIEREEMIFDNAHKDVLKKIIEEYYNIPSLDSKKRNPDRVIASQMFQYFLFNFFKMGKSEIGRYLKTDHSTVIHSLRKINNYLDVDIDGKLRNDIKQIKMKMLFYNQN